MLCSYKLLIFLSLMLMYLCVSLILSGSVSDNLEKSAADLNTKLRNLRINETEQTLKQLDKVIDQYKFPIIHQSDARQVLLDTVENFRKLYGAKITSPVKEEDSSFAVGIEFSFIPSVPEDVIRLLEYLNGSVSPIYRIDEAAFTNENGVRSVLFRAEIIQPYQGGIYVY